MPEPAARAEASRRLGRGLPEAAAAVHRSARHRERTMPGTQGFLIVLAYRLLQMCIALLGLYYYLAGRREVDELMHEAEEAAEKESTAEPDEEAMLVVERRLRLAEHRVPQRDRQNVDAQQPTNQPLHQSSVKLHHWPANARSPFRKQTQRTNRQPQ